MFKEVIPGSTPKTCFQTKSLVVTSSLLSSIVTGKTIKTLEIVAYLHLLLTEGLSTTRTITFFLFLIVLWFVLHLPHHPRRFLVEVQHVWRCSIYPFSSGFYQWMKRSQLPLRSPCCGFYPHKIFKSVQILAFSSENDPRRKNQYRRVGWRRLLSKSPGWISAPDQRNSSSCKQFVSHLFLLFFVQTWMAS